MTVDLTKLILHTAYDAFKQSSVAATGTVTISGIASAGTNTKTFTVNLATTPDMVDIVFNGPTNALVDPRPSGGWFKRGYVWVPTNNAGGGNPSRWTVFGNITGNVLTITCIYAQQFTTGETLTSTDLSYRIIDYSVF